MERPIRCLRDSFFYGREFVNDEDLNAQALRWLEGTANVRRHGTTGERPVDRFERDEQGALGPLAGRPYRRLGMSQPPTPTPRSRPAVQVGRSVRYATTRLRGGRAISPSSRASSASRSIASVTFLVRTPTRGAHRSLR